jgi:PmbA protein
MMEEKTLLESALDVLRAAGAEGDAFLEQRKSLHLGVREGKLEDISRAEVIGLGLRAIKDGRLGFVYTTALDADGVSKAAQKAVSLSAAASPREDLLLADPAGPGDGTDEGAALGSYDPTIEKKSIAEKEEWARAAESLARGYDPRIRRTDGANYNEDLAGYWIANTKGLFRHSRRSHIEVGLSVIAEDQGEMQPGEVGVETLSWAGLPDPGELGRRAGERAVRLLGGRPVATGKFPVVFSRDTGWTLLVYLSAALNGMALSRGRSWLAGRTDEKIGSPLVTIHDDGRKIGGPAVAPFDGEGVDTRDTILIDGGKITSSLRDLAAGKRLGLPSTGNSRRDGYEALPGIGTGNMYLAPGSAGPEELLAKVDRGLWVWGLSGWWLGIDPSNPQFSSAASGLWIEKGKPAQAVARVTVAGSITDILNGVEEVGNDLVWERSTVTPTFRVGSMTISGS